MSTRISNGLTRFGEKKSPLIMDITDYRNDFAFPIEQAFNKFFDDFTSNSRNSIISAGGYPKLDVNIDDNYWIITAAVPGLGEDDLSVDVERVDNSHIVKISGRIAEEYRYEDTSSKTIHKELHKSKFIRSVTLPEYVDGEPEATLKDGILTLKWKHNKDIAINGQSKKIPIKKLE